MGGMTNIAGILILAACYSITVVADSYSTAIDKFSKNDKEIYAFVKGEEDNIRLSIYGSQTKAEIGQFNFQKDKFVKECPTIFNHQKFKAVVFLIDELTDHTRYVQSLRIIIAKKETIPYVFMNLHQYMPSTIFVAANVEVKVGESVVQVLVDRDGYVVTEFIYTKKGYKEGEHRDCKNIKKMKAEEIREKILGTNDPQKVILHANTPSMPSMKVLTEKVLKDHSSKLVVLEEPYEKYEAKLVFEKVKWLLDPKNTKFHILSLSFNNYMIVMECEGKKYPILTCEQDEVLPFNETVIIPKLPFNYFVAFSRYNDLEINTAAEVEFPNSNHAYAIRVEVDSNNFFQHTVNAAMNLNLLQFPKILNAKFPSKIPVIAFCNERSFIFVYEEDSYEFLESWNGKSGKELFITFDQKTPTFFEEATKRYLSDNSVSLIHNIIKTMSTAPDKLEASPSCGLKITHDSNNPVLIQYSSFEGPKKATPAFLMALLLKEHLKEIKSEAAVEGGIPKEIAIALFDDLDNDSHARVIEGLQKSCKLSGVKCSFIEAMDARKTPIPSRKSDEL